MENEKIKIVGSGNKLFDYSEVEDIVVKIQGLYYRRDSTELVRLKDLSGKLRYFREKSPLITKDESGNYILKEMGVVTEDGIWLDKSSPNVIEINGKYHRKIFCTQINGKWLLKSDPTIVKDALSNKQEYILKSESVLLSPKQHSKPTYVHKDNKQLVLYKDEYFLQGDCMYLWSLKESKLVFVPSIYARDKHLGTLTIDFQDKTNPQEDRLLQYNFFTEEATNDNIVTISLLPEVLGTITIPTSLREYFQHAIDNYIAPRHMTKLETVKATLNKNFSDLDERENLAKTFKYVARPYPGKQELFRPKYYPKPVKSKTFAFTGALRYSFGVEFETSQGLLPHQLCDDLDLFAVGDRSIGAGEYVTAPLMGDAGINRLEAQCKALAEHTLVDDRCGIHVHVGTLFVPTEKKKEPSAKEAPTFNKEFLINSINLGAYLEEELYSSLPKNRKPTLYHCHSIRRWAGINDSNFDTYLGAYIFGPKELWYSEGKEPIRPFDFAPYKLGKDYNSTRSVGTWAEGRYKWLNLIHSYTRSSHKTIEFRIFSATTVFDKVYAYVLTALAFTYVADNVPKIIAPGVTLSQVFAAAYNDYPDIQGFLNSFYEERKLKFKRKDLYPKTHPYLSLK